MFSRLAYHLSSSFQKLPKRIFSTLPTNLSKLNSLFDEADSQLSNPSSYISAINNLKIGTSLSSQLYPDDPIVQSYWYSKAALFLAEKNLLKESEEFLKQGIQLYDQHDTKTESKNWFKVCYIIAETYLLHQNLDKSEEYYDKCFNVVDIVQPESKINIIEKLIITKLALKKFKEVAALSEDALIICKDKEDSTGQLVRILTCYGNALINMNEFDKAIKIVNKTLPLLDLKEKDEKTSVFIIVAYNSLVDAYIGNGNEDEASQAVLKGGKLIEKRLDGRKALSFYDEMCKKFKFRENVEPIIKAVVELSEKTLTEYSEIIQVYKTASEFYFRGDNLEESLDYSKKVLSLARKWNDPTAMLDSYTQLAEIYLKTDPEISKSYIEFGMALLETYPNKDHQRSLEYLKYQYYLIQQDYENANDSITTCISCVADTLENAKMLINLHIDHSLLHYEYIRTEKALISLNKALETSEKYFPKNTLERSEILTKIGSLLIESGELEKGLEYLTEALEIEEKNNNQDLSHLIIIYTNIMECYSKMNQLNLALETGEGIVKIIKDRGFEGNEHLGIFYLAFGQVYQKMIKKDKAKSCYLKARDIFKRMELEEYIEMAEGYLSECESYNIRN